MSKFIANVSPALGVVVAATVFTTPLTMAVVAPKAANSLPGWSVKCTKWGTGLNCQAQQTIALRTSGKRLLTVSVGRGEKGKPGTALLRLPHGIYVPDGVKLGIDAGKAKPVQVQMCNAGGCYAGAKIEARDLSAMQSGKELAISFKNLQKTEITVKVPLAGFSAAYKNLK